MKNNYDIVLHVGGSKCGSSSLQSVLSQNPTLQRSEGVDLAYAVINPDGSVLLGEEITTKASNNVSGYLSSAPLNTPEQYNIVEESVLSLITSTKGRVLPIISCEGWFKGDSVEYFHKLIEKHSLKVKVLLFMRPPLDWANSAYWQWFCWNDKIETIDKYVQFLKNSKTLPDWPQIIREWDSIEGVDLSVHTLEQGVIPAFEKEMSVSSTIKEVALNASSSQDLIQFLSRNRRYRRDMHSPWLEFIMSRNVTFSGDTSRWVFKDRHLRSLKSYAHVDFSEVSGALTKETLQQIEANPKWDSISPYLGRFKEFSDSKLQAADRLISDLMQVVISHDQQDRNYTQPKYSLNQVTKTSS